MPEYSYPAVELTGLAGPGPSTMRARSQTLQERLDNAPPVPARDIQNPGGIRRDHSGWYEKEDKAQYLRFSGHEDTYVVFLGNEEEFYYPQAKEYNSDYTGTHNSNKTTL